MLNISCALIISSFAIWTIADPNSISKNITIDTVILLQNISSIGWISFASFFASFSLVFSKREKLLKKNAVLIFILPLILLYKQWTTGITLPPVLVDYGWYVGWKESFWAYLFYVYYVSFMLISIYIIYRYGTQTKIIAEKKQSKIVVITTIVSLIAVTITDIIIPSFDIPAIPQLGQVILLVFAVGIIYAIVKYEFLTVSFAFAAENIISTMEELLILTDHEGNILNVNNAVIDSLNYEQKELSGKSVSILFSESSFTIPLMERITRGEKIKNNEAYLLRKDANVIPVIFSCSPLKDKEGDIRGIVFIASDITERKRAEEILIENEAKYRTLVTQSPDGIFIVDLSGAFLSVNKTMCDNLKYSEDELLSMKLWDIIPLEYMSMHKNRLADIIKGERKNEAAEYEVKGKDGIVHSIEVLSAPYYKDKVIIGFQGIARDITEKKRIEEALKEREEKFKELFDNAPIGYHELDSLGRIAWINRTELDMLGYTEEEMIGQFAWKFVEDKESSKQRVSEKLKGIRPPAKGEERIYSRKDQTKFPVMVEDLILHDAADRITGIRTTIQDITKHKQAEDEIAMLSHSLKSINECVSITDLENKILFVNEAFLKTYGYEINELVGKNISIIRSKSSEQKQVNEILQATISGEWQGECLNKRKDGSEFTIYLSTTVIKDKDNKIIGLIGVATDITERKRTEKELIEAKNKAEESDRLKSAFLANMSHEVRTPLNSIIGFSELLADPDFEEEQKDEFIQHIISNGNNLLSIISDIMDISKMESGEFKIHRVKIKAQKFISTIKEQFAKQAEEKKLELRLIHPDNYEETVVLADTERLKQIFNNLLSNAIKFTTHGRIEIGYQPKGAMVLFYVRDTGIGIPEEYHRIIFERFRQVEAEKTRKFGGNGLGLAITKNLVELMGGEIWLESESGIGSTFYFTLPAYNSKL